MEEEVEREMERGGPRRPGESRRGPWEEGTEVPAWLAACFLSPRGTVTAKQSAERNVDGDALENSGSAVGVFVEAVDRECQRTDGNFQGCCRGHGETEVSPHVIELRGGDTNTSSWAPPASTGNTLRWKVLEARADETKGL